MDSSLNERLHLSLQQLRSGFEAERMPSLASRRDRLQRLITMTERHQQALAEAISQDFGHRSADETALLEVFPTLSAARHTLRHLKAWMKPRRVATGLAYLPGRNRLMRQPLGVVGIISPWNYPFFMTTGPLIGVLAAGNRAMIKPSELTPRTSALLARMVAEHFAPDEIQVIPGDVEVASAFSQLPFDHLVFTGSTAVGRLVAQAAAKNLTPVTLELGGKSPAIVDRSADLLRTARSLAHTKLLNAGQTCVAPDYVLAPRELLQPLAEAIVIEVRKLWPSVAANADLSGIVSDRHHARLRAMLDEARAAGATLLPTHPEEIIAQGSRKLVPHLVIGADASLRLMQEEIFGPVLPLIPYERPEDAIAHVNRHDRPLALYWFGEDRARREQVLTQTHSGGVSINECVLQLAQDNQPFGGIGPSGMGHYHGEWGFRSFSKEKPVFLQSRWSGVPLLKPPYGARFRRMLDLLKRIG